MLVSQPASLSEPHSNVDRFDPLNFFNFDVFDPRAVAPENSATYDSTSLVWALHLWRVCQGKVRTDLNGCELAMDAKGFTAIAEVRALLTYI
jgi:hypothetical protein